MRIYVSAKPYFMKMKILTRKMKYMYVASKISRLQKI